MQLIFFSSRSYNFERRKFYMPYKSKKLINVAIACAILPISFAASAFSIRGLNDKCVDVRSSGTANGTPVQLWDCNGSAAQEWYFDRGRIIGIGGKCLDVQYGIPYNGTPIHLWDCNNTPAQNWGFINNFFQGLGGRCLDVRGANPANGTPLQIWDCVDQPQQKWRLVTN